MIESLDDVRVVEQPMPGTIKAFARKMKSGQYLIVVNAALDDEGKQKAIKHELEHIKRNDFERDEPVDSIEMSM